MQKTAQLKIVNRFGAMRLLPLDKPVFTIGRKAENDLQLLSDTVSRQHAEIVYQNDAYYLVDIGSKRGTYVNDQRIERAQLQHQDRIRVGNDDDQQIIFLDDTVERASAIFTSSSQLSLSPSTRDRDRAQITSANEELQKLSRFIEVNQAFKFQMTPDDVLCLIVDAAVEITGAERGFLMLRNETGDLEFKVARDRHRNWLVGNEPSNKTAASSSTTAPKRPTISRAKACAASTYAPSPVFRCAIFKCAIRWTRRWS
jgi:hypothetical protein